jgi:hypothetical protein
MLILSGDLQAWLKSLPLFRPKTGPAPIAQRCSK